MLYLATDVIRTHDEPMYKLDKRAKDLTGMKFNKLTALRPLGRAPGSRAVLWKCRCECGSEVDIRGDTLQREAKSCGKGACMREHYLDYPKEGGRFGMLTALGYSHSGKKGGGVYWNFRCDCGKEAKIRWNRVRDGERDHCGCQSLKKMVEGHYTNQDRDDQAIKEMISQYRRNAARRKLSFDITDAQFRYLIQQNCFYCGSTPKHARFLRKRLYLSDGNTVVNGIDRYDPNMGYSVENCVPCCKICNYAKRSESPSEYLEWVQNLAVNIPQNSAEWDERKKAVEKYLRLLSKSF